MSDENEFEGNEGEGIASLRKQYNAMKKQQEDLLAELGKYRAQEKTSTVASVLKAKGLPEKAASLYTGDDVSEDAVGKWVESYADIFGVQAQAQQQEQDANAQAAQRTSAAAFENADPGVGQAGQVVLGDPEEMERLMRSLPFEELQKRGWQPSTPGLFSR